MTDSETRHIGAFDISWFSRYTDSRYIAVKFAEKVINYLRQLLYMVKNSVTLSQAAFALFDGEQFFSVNDKMIFTVGHGTAKILSDILNVPLYEFSHQNGHIAAALYSSNKTELVGQTFLAFHVSGGTTESVIVQPHEENIFQIELVGKTLDLNAGQLIDRIGVMLGLGFPCGRELEQLALKSNATIKAKATLKDTDCCLSGIENICKKAFSEGMSKEDVSLMCLMYVEKAIAEMCEKILKKYGEMPVIFAGGVMSDKIIKDRLSAKFNAYFAEPEFSADNAGGTAFLTYLKHKHMGAGILIPAEVKGE